MTAEQRRRIREARDANQRRRLARARAGETHHEREARHVAEAESYRVAAEHVPHVPVSELRSRVPGMGNAARHGNGLARPDRP